MSFLHNLYFFQGQKYTSFGKNILHRQSASLGHSATGHSEGKATASDGVWGGVPFSKTEILQFLLKIHFS